MKKQTIYILTIVSTCLEGQDIHSYPFKTKKEALEAMKSQYKCDLTEIKKSCRVNHIDRNGYEIYEDGRFVENHLVATIIKSEI